MRSRWFHSPFLHSPALGLEKKATWLELFYDLIFVAAFIQLGNGLSGHVSVAGALLFAAVFVPLWTAWTGFTFYQNRYAVDDFLHRTLVFFQMFSVAGMALTAADVLDGKTLGFSISAGLAQLLVSAMYLRASLQVEKGRAYSRYWGTVFAIGGGSWLIAAAVPAPWSFGLWAFGTMCVFAAPLSRQSTALQERFPIDFEHLGERYGLLTIIVLGESFVKVLTALVDERAGFTMFLEGGVVLLITCGIWWVYFDDVAGSHIKKGRGKWVIWLYAHLPLQASITVVGVALKKSIAFSWDEPAPTGYRWMLAGALAVVYFSVAALDSVSERKQAEVGDRARVNARWISAVVLLVLAPAGRAMSGGLFLSLVAAITFAQVIFDMMIAPLEEDEHSEVGRTGLADIARERARTGGKGPTRVRRDISEAVRKGTPAALRRDLYFYFMEGSWTRVFAAFAFLFCLANVFFAGLYVLEPGSIKSAGEDSFADAFFFSIQTMSTIGYGTLSPGSDYGNMIVSVEAALSVIGIAIVTGLVVAKASRPRSSVLFSRNMILTKMHGKDVLSFRVGNARGNDVAEASMSVAVIKDEISPEGHHMRRLHDLKLHRDRSPIFILSWSAMHDIDADSPLADVDWAAPDDHLVAFVVTLIGHDGTYGQTIYARHLYQGEDVLLGRRFVDVISQLPDGRIMIDYTCFHDTVPEGDTSDDEDELEDDSDLDPA